MANEKNVIQNIILESREKLSVSGVLDILTFDEDEITLETELGQLNIKGENLKV
ncbi:MAG: YabP/YqfC family sporulation protein [Clostridia bacterium]|nr:YabP/YqfC family sporulation protein [Clostridia bacterium]